MLKFHDVIKKYNTVKMRTKNRKLEKEEDIYIKAHRMFATEVLKPHPTYTEFILSGGRHSGKSDAVYCSALDVLRKGLGNIMICREYGVTLKGTSYGTLKEIITRNGWEDEFEYREGNGASGLLIRHKTTGCFIKFTGLDKPDSVRSAATGSDVSYFMVIFEEAQQMKEYKVIIDIRTSLDRGGQYPLRTVVMYNPTSFEKDWYNVEFAVEEPFRYRHLTTYLDMPKKYVKDGIIQDALRMRERNYAMYRNVYLGLVGGAEGKVFTNVKPLDFKPPLHKFNKKYRGADWGTGELSGSAYEVAGYDKETEELYVLFEFYMNAKTHPNRIDRVPSTFAEGMLKEQAPYFKNNPSLKGFGIEVLFDSAADTVINTLRGTYGLLGVRGVSSKIKLRDIVFDWLQTRKTIYIPENTQLYEQMTQLRYNPKYSVQTAKTTKDKYIGVDHAIDALLYGISELAKETL